MVYNLYVTEEKTNKKTTVVHYVSNHTKCKDLMVVKRRWSLKRRGPDTSKFLKIQ